MKNLILIVSFVLYNTCFAFCQETKKTNAHSHEPPAYFLDSIRIHSTQIYFDPDKISSIWIGKGKDIINHTSGEIYITSKKPLNYNFWGLKRIERKYTNTISKRTVFMIDNEFLKDGISTYGIDSAYIFKVKILKSSEIDYLKKIKPVFSIIQIKLRTKYNLDEANKIRIRGSEISSLK